jgi:hypothetical protein
MSIAKIKGSALPPRNTAENTDYVLVISGGVTYKMLRSVFLAGITVSQDLQGVLDNGKTAEFTDGDGIRAYLNLGDNVDDLTSFIFQIYDPTSFGQKFNEIKLALGEASLKTKLDNKTGTLSTLAGKPFMEFFKFFQVLGPGLNSVHNQKISFEDVEEVFEENIQVEYVPKPKYVSGKYYLITQDDLDNAIEGLKTKQPVRLATTATITLLGHQTIDGVLTVENDRILVKDHSTASLNGIYLAKEDFWLRTDDANTATELTNAVVSVLEGTANSGSTYRQVTTSITLETSNIVWQSFGSSVPDATDSTKGKAKLAAAFGSNTDTAIRQDFFTSTINKIENFFISKQNGTFGSHTGDLLETVLSSDDVVGGFFVAGDTMLILISGEKSGAVANVTYRIRFGTTGTTSDELIATYTGNNRGLNMQRVNISFLSGNLVRVISPTTSLISDSLGTNAAFSEVSLTYSAAWKITITAQLGNAGETASIRTLRASKIKSIT